ncbi:MAG: sulfite exporter TauE/SafE family protein [Patescibacteria group bacterium]|nr:sulfite exporter TauE/SafE family protein [Patescibacteria group bacterium]
MEILGIAVLTLLASMVGTLTGFGTSTIMVPVLLFFFGPLETLLFVGVIHLFGDVWKMLLFRKGADWRLIALFGIPGVLFSYLGSTATLSLPPQLLSRALGVFLIVYVVFLLAKKGFRIPKNRVTALVGGAMSGFFAGIFGIGGAVRGAFLAAFKLKKAVYLFTAGTIAFFIDVTRIGNYLLGGATIESVPSYSLLLFIPISLLGALAAKRILRHVPEKKFAYLVAAFLLVVGIKLLLLP